MLKFYLLAFWQEPWTLRDQNENMDYDIKKTQVLSACNTQTLVPWERARATREVAAYTANARFTDKNTLSPHRLLNS